MTMHGGHVWTLQLFCCLFPRNKNMIQSYIMWFHSIVCRKYVKRSFVATLIYLYMYSNYLSNRQHESTFCMIGIVLSVARIWITKEHMYK